MTPNLATAIRVAMVFAAVKIFWRSDASGTLSMAIYFPVLPVSPLVLPKGDS